MLCAMYYPYSTYLLGQKPVYLGLCARYSISKPVCCAKNLFVGLKLVYFLEWELFMCASVCYDGLAVCIYESIEFRLRSNNFNFDLQFTEWFYLEWFLCVAMSQCVSAANAIFANDRTSMDSATGGTFTSDTRPRLKTTMWGTSTHDHVLTLSYVKGLSAMSPLPRINRPNGVALRI